MKLVHEVKMEVDLWKHLCSFQADCCVSSQIIDYIDISISIREDMLLPWFVCWFVCLSAELLEKLCINVCEIVGGRSRSWDQKLFTDFPDDHGSDCQAVKREYYLESLPSPPLDNILVIVIVWKLRGNIIRTALCWIV